MAMGMSYNEYWDGTPYIVKHYREAYKIKQNELNAQAWLHGLYTYIGIATALNNGFNSQKKEYPVKPIDLHPQKKEETPEEIRDRYYQRFKHMEEMWKAQHGETDNG